MRAQHDLVLSSFMFGMPYMSRPPMRSARSKTVTEWPARLSWAAAQRPAGPGADDGDLFAGADFGRLGHDPAFVPAVVDDGAFDVLDGDGRGVDAEHARAFAGGGADAAGEVGEIIGFVQAFEGFVPEAAIDQVVPFGDEVVDGAAGGHAAEQGAGVAEGNAAIHAAGALLAQLGFVQVQVEFVPVADALRGPSGPAAIRAGIR